MSGLSLNYMRKTKEEDSEEDREEVEKAGRVLRW